MVKKFRKHFEIFWNHYGRKITYALTILTVILSIAGSYQYYSNGIYAEEVIEDRLWSSVAYSALKLYLFSPTVNPGKLTPITYEIAKWLAPLCTAYWVFKALESLVWHGMGIMRRRFSKKKQIVIFGYHEDCSLFIDNIYHENLDHEGTEDDRMITLVTEKPLEKEEQLKLERKGVIIYQMNFLEDIGTNKEKNLKMLDDFHKLKLWKADEVVLFYQDATLNFIIFTRLLELIENTDGKHWKGKTDGKETIICAFQCDDIAVKKVVSSYYSNPEMIGSDTSDVKILYNPFDLKIFSIPELAAAEAVLSVPLYENCLPEWDGNEAAGDREFEDYMKKVKNPHVLIAGFGDYGQAFFEKVLLMGTLSNVSAVFGYSRLRITVIDEKADYYKDIIYARYPRLSKICDTEFLSLDICGRKLEKKLDALPMFTYAAVCFGNQTTGILTMMQLVKYSYIRAKGARIPVVTRMKTDGAMVDYMRSIRFHMNEKGSAIQNYEYVVPFGSKNRLLTRKNLINSEMERNAKQFHESYSKESVKVYQNSSGQQSWNELDFEKKESNRAQVLNQPYFKELLERLRVKLPDEEMVLTDEMYLSDMLEDGKVLDILAGLEHQRWCNFCYVYGYVGRLGDKKRTYEKVEDNGKCYYGMVHNCLIDDWRKMKENPEVRDTIKFDLCSIYCYRDVRGRT